MDDDNRRANRVAVERPPAGQAPAGEPADHANA
jgi:hypothetical protein